MILHVGTSNLVLPGSKKDFPEQFQHRSRLFYYSTLFNSIELNSTFYKIPKLGTFQRWANDVTGNFTFTIKLWRGITHVKKLAYDTNDISMFLKASQGLGHRKGCLLIQFPSSITCEFQDHVEKLLDDIADHDEASAWRLCLEFRHVSWYNENVYDMLRHRNASPVFHDIQASRTPITLASSWKTIYLRFHGPLGNYRGEYTEETVHLYAAMIKAWHHQGKTVYAYFNNTIGSAFQNAVQLKTLTESSALPD